ncbi:MAG: hypothetical protein DU429_01175 [Candidatus Tokpelaia sp.]|nr:MAG: hypothetical protein DU430_02805 [Candidatus Tokpelaia sp.]KAA6207681.1 MAG: hypothetical protein DU429_01175 [Candidatus Tokpelaia sp.]
MQNYLPPAPVFAAKTRALAAMRPAWTLDPVAAGVKRQARRSMTKAPGLSIVFAKAGRKPQHLRDKGLYNQAFAVEPN